MNGKYAHKILHFCLEEGIVSGYIYQILKRDALLERNYSLVDEYNIFCF